MWAYPWDFLDEGPRLAASRIGATGVDAVSVAAVYHPVEQVRPHLGASTLVHPGTTAWFTPDETRYRGTPLRPAFQPRDNGIDPLALIAGACAEANLELNAWLVCCYAITLGRAHPELCQRNVLGDRLRASLCPSQPAVQAYILAVIGELVERHPIRRLDLESLQYLARWPETLHEKNGLPFGPVEHYLRSLCVCSACASRAKTAGIDIEAVKATVRSHFREFARTGDPSPRPVADFIAGRPEFSHFHNFRREVLRELYALVRAAALPTPTSVLTSGTGYASGLCTRDALAMNDLVCKLFYAAPAANLRQLEQLVAEEGVAPDRLLASLIAFGPNCPNAGILVETMVAFARCGVRHFAIYNYGVMRLDQLDWIRTAIDAARSVI